MIYLNPKIICLASILSIISIDVFGNQSSRGKAKDSNEGFRHLERARTLVASNDAGAEREYQLAIKGCGKRCPEALLELSSFLARRWSRFSDAARLLQEYIQKTPSKNHSVDSRNVKYLQEAATLQRRIGATTRPHLEDFLALYTRILGYGNSDDLVPLMERAIRLYPESSKAHLKLAAALKGDQSNRVQELCSRAVALSPDDADIHTEAGWCYWMLAGRTHEASKEFYKALELTNGENADAWRGLANTLPFEGKKVEAVEAFRNYWRMRKAPLPDDEALKRRIELIEKEIASKKGN